MQNGRASVVLVHRARSEGARWTRVVRDTLNDTAMKEMSKGTKNDRLDKHLGGSYHDAWL